MANLHHGIMSLLVERTQTSCCQTHQMPLSADTQKVNMLSTNYKLL